MPDECEKPLKSFDLDYVNNTRCMHQCYFYSLRCIIIITAMERTKWERIRKHLKKSRKRTFRAWWKQFLFIFYIVYFLLNNCFLIVHFSLFSNNLQPAKTTKQPVIALGADAFWQPWVFPPNDVWETSAKIPYWWCITTKIWVVLLIGRTTWEIWFNQSEILPWSG